MRREFGPPPIAAEIEALAHAALERLPDDFRRYLGDVVMQVEEFASEEVLAELGIENPFELSGLYQGIALTHRSIEQSGTMPDRIFLYRRALLEEWAARGDVTLEDLVTHVVVHEVGHHFGLSDDDIHALEDAAG
jgi:predicted Zn-dependent protease with MMP-like domain